ncbi:MAG: hypothetical protein N4A61_03555 [Pelagimonas sp.]|jgi:mono/diheme cytochrome c family protein|nr:hypothetical protein [Pelagimonas sp.]
MALTLLAVPAWADGTTVEINPPDEGSVSKAQGLAAWARIYEVASHPRCANCHTGESDRPMWSGPSYGKTRVHGMNIQAGESRMGVEYTACQTCHTTKAEDWDNANATPHTAPRVTASWQLAPVEADWFGRSSVEICEQLRDPERNGDRDMMELAEHLDHDVILHWAWAPGGTREPAPYSLQEHVNDILTWGIAGMPCPQN